MNEKKQVVQRVVLRQTTMTCRRRCQNLCVMTKNTYLTEGQSEMAVLRCFKKNYHNELLIENG